MKYITKDISQQVLMIGVYYKRNAPGGMATVIKNYEEYIEDLRYIYTWKLSNKFKKLIIAIFAYIKFFFILLLDKKIKIVHIHGAAYASFTRKKYFIKIAKHFNKKVIYHMHGGEFMDFYSKNPNKKQILEIINTCCDLLIVLSQSWQDYFESIGVPPQKIKLLNNCIPFPKEKSMPLACNENKIVNLLFLGTLVKEKGIFDLLEVISENCDLFLDKIKLVIGGNKNEALIQEFIHERNLEHFVTFEGWISGENKIKEYQKADIFILPSYFEALPMVLLEAMSYRCAIISTKVGGIPDLIHNNVNGVLIEAGNHVELKEALLYLLNNKTIIEDYKNMGVDLVKPYYADSVFKELKQVYENFL